MVKYATKYDAGLLSKLTTKQGELSDYKFAPMIGVERTLWVNARNGKSPIGITLLKAIVRNYPEIIPDVIEYLRDGHEPT